MTWLSAVWATDPIQHHHLMKTIRSRSCTRTTSFMTCPILASFFDQVRKRLDKTSGCWIIVDVPCHPALARNIHQPGAPLWFGYSCLLCLASATSSRDGQGLGTCGFPASLCQKWAHEAGFEHFEKRTVEGCSMDSCFVLG